MTYDPRDINLNTNRIDIALEKLEELMKPKVEIKVNKNIDYSSIASILASLVDRDIADIDSGEIKLIKSLHKEDLVKLVSNLLDALMKRNSNDFGWKYGNQITYDTHTISTPMTPMISYPQLGTIRVGDMVGINSTNDTPTVTYPGGMVSVNSADNTTTYCANINTL